MTLNTERRTRGEHIGDILTALEHLWKMQPSVSLETLLFDDIGMRMGGMSDDEIETRIREQLRLIMSGTRDRT